MYKILSRMRYFMHHNLLGCLLGTKNCLLKMFNQLFLTLLLQNKEIECELICEKNLGKVHAKYSPVATAYY